PGSSSGGRMGEWGSGGMGEPVRSSHSPILPFSHSAEKEGLGWRLKGLHYLMVTSSTYRQRSAPAAPGALADPENRLLGRMNPRRLDAEALRDAVLQAAGTLNIEMGGPPVRVPLEPE